MKDVNISEILLEHYRSTFLLHGSTIQGVDWGDNEHAAIQRQEKMLEVVRGSGSSTLLDVGCGFGALAEIIEARSLPLIYSGIDVVEEMILAARQKQPNLKFICGDILATELGGFDYVVCNGVLTQKMGASTLAMNQFANRLIKKMYDIANVGIAFNVMSTHVNFQRDNLYYRNPSEILAWCMSELTPHVRLDSAYQPWFEYTVYLYKPDHIRQGAL